MGELFPQRPGFFRGELCETSSEEFCERFLMEQKVAVIPGSAFGPGGEGFVRACYAASMQDLEEAVSRMETFLEVLGRKQARKGN